MKALTIWQPWASLLAQGEKKYETRSWPTKYRGPIAIHAAARDPLKLPMIPGLEDTIGSWLFLPTGAIIAIGELVNVWRIVCHPGTDVDVAKHINIGAESLSADKHAPDFGDYFVPTEKELALGDWTPGRYAWEIKITKLLESPVVIKGKQGLWNADLCVACRYNTHSVVCHPHCGGCDGVSNYEPVRKWRRCTFCGVPVEPKHEHNPAPVADGICCEKCNATVVIPARIATDNKDKEETTP